MHVALSARVSTPHQHQEGTMASQVQARTQDMHQQEWSLLPAHASLDAGLSGVRLERPGLERLRDAAQRGACDAVVILSPDRFARHDAPPWLLIAECETLHVHLIFLQPPCGDTPQGQRLTLRPGMMAAYERAQMLERTRRGRLEHARRGAWLPWASRCSGSHSLPTRPGGLPQVVSDLEEAEVVRHLSRLCVEEHLRCRQITTRLHEAHLPTPSGQHQVWQPATVRTMLTHHVYAGHARSNARQPSVPPSRKKDDAPRRSLTTGRRDRPDTAWVWSEAPALIAPEGCANAPLPWRRHAEVARNMSQPRSRRSVVRRRVTWGECGLGMGWSRDVRVSQKRYAYWSSHGTGHSPLTCGRVDTCLSRRGRADRLDPGVWDTLWQW